MPQEAPQQQRSSCALVAFLAAAGAPPAGVLGGSGWWPVPRVRLRTGGIPKSWPFFDGKIWENEDLQFLEYYCSLLPDTQVCRHN
jgi:hypothetical protein